nr:GIY-YIG nuclease family protein [uncultured Fluviicola sp.]
MQSNHINNLINNSLVFGKSSYEKILAEQNFSIYSIPLNCIDLEEVDYTNQKSKHPLSEKIKESFFRQFDSFDPLINKKNCLYIFSFDESKCDTAVMIKAYQNPTISDRNMSAMKSKPNCNTNVLYVGKVKKDLGGRLSTHFGYANHKTGGLQLKYWAKEIQLELIVTFIVFEDKIDDYLNPLELYLTKELNPLIGKSR